MIGEVSNAPECRDCDGHCCEKFAISIQSSKRPWARRRALKRITELFPFFKLNGDMVLDNGLVHVPMRCDMFKDGRCTIYSERPYVCKAYPTEEMIDGTESGIDDCKLLERLRREKGTDAK